MNNNWWGNREAVFTFSGLAGGRTDCSASCLGELITERGGDGSPSRGPRAVITLSTEPCLSFNPRAEDGRAAWDPAGPRLDVWPDVQAPAARLWRWSRGAADLAAAAPDPHVEPGLVHVCWFCHNRTVKQENSSTTCQKMCIDADFLQ